MYFQSGSNLCLLVFISSFFIVIWLIFLTTEDKDQKLWSDSLSDSVDKNHVSEDDRQPLEEHHGRAGIVQILHHQHVSVKVLSYVGQAELEPGEERRVVQGPLWCVL